MNKQFMKKPKWPFNTKKDAHLTKNYRMQIKYIQWNIKKSDTISFIKMGKTINSIIGSVDEDMKQYSAVNWYSA